MARTKSAPSSRPGRRSQRLEAKKKRKEEAKSAVIAAKDLKAKPKRFHRPRQRKRSHFLNLPGELRNRIYEYALLQPAEIIVSPEGPGQPALLSTCRKIRREAGTIYYGRNVFTMAVKRYNGAAFMPWAKQARKFNVRGQEQNVKFKFDFFPNWDNLVSWIHATYEECAFEPEWSEPLPPDHRVAANAFKLVEVCERWWSKEGRERVLKSLYEVLRGSFSDWVKPEDFIGPP